MTKQLQVATMYADKNNYAEIALLIKEQLIC